MKDKQLKLAPKVPGNLQMNNMRLKVIREVWTKISSYSVLSPNPSRFTAAQDKQYAF
jgi:hypothetical protein